MPAILLHEVMWNLFRFRSNTIHGLQCVLTLNLLSIINNNVFYQVVILYVIIERYSKTGSVSSPFVWSVVGRGLLYLTIRSPLRVIRKGGYANWSDIYVGSPVCLKNVKFVPDSGSRHGIIEE